MKKAPVFVARTERRPGLKLELPPDEKQILFSISIL